MSKTTPTIDLRPDHLKIVRDILRRHIPERKVVAFGSRATWTAREYSDLDLAILGDEPLTLSVSATLEEDFSDSDLPFKVDLIDWARLDDSFRDRISQDQVVVQIPARGSGRLGAVDTWTKTTIGDAFEVNPRRSIRRGDVTPFIPMDALPAHSRSAERIETREFKGSGTRFQNGDTLIARITPCLENGKTIFISELPDDTVAHGSTEYIVLAEREGLSDRLFAYYLAKSPDFRRYAVGQMEGTSGRQRVPAKAVEKYRIHLPPLAEQRAIAHILGTLDDKIELNRQMNETLEAMARAIFKDWFVDFGPTRAKMEGRDSYLPPEIWDLFPDALDDEGKPVDWKISEIGKEVRVVGGATPSTKEQKYWEGGEHHWTTPKDLSSLTSPVLLHTNKKITDAGVRRISSGILPVGTVLLSSRAPIGYLAIAEVPTSINQGFIAMVCDKRLPNLFVLFWCHGQLDHIKGIAGGSTFSEINKKAFRPLPIIFPPKQVSTAYEKAVRPLYERIVANLKESASLVEIRDLLLPKLISGEIRVRDAQAQVGETLKRFSDSFLQIQKNIDPGLKELVYRSQYSNQLLDARFAARKLDDIMKHMHPALKMPHDLQKFSQIENNIDELGERLKIMHKIGEDLKQMVILNRGALKPAADQIRNLSEMAARAVFSHQNNLKKMEQWQSSLAEKMSALNMPWALKQNPDISAIGFARLVRLCDHATGTSPFSPKSSEIFNKELGVPTFYDASHEQKERELARIDAGLNPEVIAFPIEVYPDVLISTGFTLHIEIDSSILSDKGGHVYGNFHPFYDFLIRKVESCLRSSIETELLRLDGDDWITNRIPERLVDKWEKTKSRDEKQRRGGLSHPLISYAYFPDLPEVICRDDNWEAAFQCLFISKEDFQVSMKRLNTIRKNIFHGRPLDRAEQLTLCSEAYRILTALGIVELRNNRVVLLDVAKK